MNCAAILVFLAIFCSLSLLSDGYPYRKGDGGTEQPGRPGYFRPGTGHRHGYYHHHHHHHDHDHDHGHEKGENGGEGPGTGVFIPRFPNSSDSGKVESTGVDVQQPIAGNGDRSDEKPISADEEFEQKPQTDFGIVKPGNGPSRPSQPDSTFPVRDHHIEGGDNPSKDYPEGHGSHDYPKEHSGDKQVPKDTDNVNQPDNSQNPENERPTENGSQNPSGPQSPNYPTRPITPGGTSYYSGHSSNGNPDSIANRPNGPTGPRTQSSDSSHDYPDSSNSENGPKRPLTDDSRHPISQEPIPDFPVNKPNSPVQPDISYGSVRPERPGVNVGTRPNNPSNPNTPFYNPDGPFVIHPEGELVPQPTKAPLAPETLPSEKNGPAPGDRTQPEVPIYKSEIPFERNPVEQRPIRTEPLPNNPPTGDVGIPTSSLPGLRDLCQTLNLNKFLTLLNRADMSDVFGGVQPVTIFAPTDEAFSQLPVHVYYRMTKDKDFLKQVLQYHIVEGTHLGNELVGNNMVVYQTRSPGLGMYLKTVKGKTYVNGCQVKTADQRANNAVVQVLNSVLYPLPSKSMVETLQSTGTFTRFYALALEAGIFEKELNGKEQYTIFAPSDAAFTKLPQKTLEWLTYDKEALKALLMKHIVRGMHFTAWSSDEDESFTSMGEAKLNMKHFKDYFTVNDIRLGTSDVMAQNGVIHLIPEVLFSKDLKPPGNFKRPSLKRIYFSTP